PANQAWREPWVEHPERRPPAARDLVDGSCDGRVVGAGAKERALPALHHAPARIVGDEEVVHPEAPLEGAAITLECSVQVTAVQERRDRVVDQTFGALKRPRQNDAEHWIGRWCAR